MNVATDLQDDENEERHEVSQSAGEFVVQGLKKTGRPSKKAKQDVSADVNEALEEAGGKVGSLIQLKNQ